MNRSGLGILAFALLFLAGCVTAPQAPISMMDTTLRPAGRMGVAMTTVPRADMHIFGAGCLLCMAVASGANSGLAEHAKSLSLEDLPKLKSDFAAALRKKGVDAVVIDEELKLDALGNGPEGPNLAQKDFRPLQAKYQVEKLLVIDISHVGFWRTYSAYVPTSDPKGVFKATGYVVNLATNSYEWYLPLDVQKSADRAWDEPPKFPGLTNAYYQAIELGRDNLLKPFGF
jgi:hypothetical protein